MPCYLFTYHTYGSWMPDRPEGYVRRGEGILPTDQEAAEQYRKNMKQDEVLLDEGQQRCAIEALLAAASHIAAAVHGAGTEPTHVHALVSWKDDRPHKQIGSSLRRRVTMDLKSRFGEHEWLSENRSRKQVKDREHFQHLMTNYLPKHSGWSWNEERGYYKSSDGGPSGEA